MSLAPRNTSGGPASSPKPNAGLRGFDPADRDACLGIFEGNLGEFFAQEERSEFVEFLSDLPGPYFVVEDDRRRVIACGGYAVDPASGRADLCWGMVERSWQGRGIGKFLLEERLRLLATEPDVKAVHLDTSQRTRGYYEQWGFRVLQIIPDGYGPGLDRCEMRLELKHGHPETTRLPMSASLPERRPTGQRVGTFLRRFIWRRDVGPLKAEAHLEVRNLSEDFGPENRNPLEEPQT